MVLLFMTTLVNLLVALKLTEFMFSILYYKFSIDYILIYAKYAVEKQYLLIIKYKPDKIQTT